MCVVVSVQSYLYMEFLLRGWRATDYIYVGKELFVLLRPPR
jgi:hypothetical protein